MQYQGKIFCLGFHKTGTSSLTKALRILGYATIHGDPRGSWPGANEGVTFIEMIRRGDFVLPTFRQFDAFSDNPYFTIWREIYNLYPQSKFILTIRDETSWINSCVKFYEGRRVRPMRQWMFGEHADPSKDDDSRKAWIARYRDHNESVQAFFSDKRDQFIVMDITQGDGWGMLCPFLSAQVNTAPFPREKVTRVGWRRALSKHYRSLISG